MYRTQGRAWYPLFSTILRYRTWIPETVKYGISKEMLIGGFFSVSSAKGRSVVGEFSDYLTLSSNMISIILPACTEGRPKWARIIKSFPPWNCLIFQIRQDFSGLYETEPLEHYK
jgi:hypothetical protein